MIKNLFNWIYWKLKDDDFLHWVKFTVFCIFIVFVLFLLQKGCSPEEVIPSDKLQPVKTYTDNNNVTHSQIKGAVVSQEMMQHLTDSITSSLKGKVIVKTVVKYTVQTDTVFKDLPVYIDSNQNFSIVKTNNYIDLKAWGSLKEQKANVSLLSRDTLTFIDYTQKRFLRANKRIVDISSKSPYNKITAGNFVTLKEPKVLFTVGPYIGYDMINRRWGTGISLNFNLISIKSKK
jgi:hypothetical protein